MQRHRPVFRAETGSGRLPRLLAVDDDPISAELFARIAARSGYEGRFTADAREAPRLAALWRPDVLTLDLCMPEFDACDVLAALKGSGFTGHVIIISGQSDELRSIAVKLAQGPGVAIAAAIAKPVDVTRLRDLLEMLKPAEVADAVSRTA